MYYRCYYGVIWKVHDIKKKIRWHPLQMWNWICHCGPSAPNDLEPQTLRMYINKHNNSAVGILKHSEVRKGPPPEILNNTAIVGLIWYDGMEVSLRELGSSSKHNSPSRGDTSEKGVKKWPGSHCHGAGTYPSNPWTLSLSFGYDQTFTGGFHLPMHFQYPGQCPTQSAPYKCSLSSSQPPTSE